MAGFIPDNIIDEIISRTDIVEIVSSYFPLKRAGRNFKALCPFHKEKTPSFMVSPDKQIFHCFGCNEGGNVLHFLMRYERLEFPEAVKVLAKRVGVNIPEMGKEARGVMELYKINHLAMQFYHHLLLNSSQCEEVRNYLLKRGLLRTTWEKFKLGFSPSAGDALVNFLKEKKQDLAQAEKTGLIRRREKGEGYFDFFRGRIIYPIFDLRQRVIGFGGRVLDDSLPKYINTPETSIYKKGETLYGLNFSREFIKEKGFVVIVEGYMDLLSPFQEGFNNLVATLGTALTPEQARLLRRYTSSVIVIYDGDKAGELAALRGLEILLEGGLEVKLGVLPSGFDPDSFVQKRGKEELAKIMGEAKNILEYKLEILLSQYDLKTIEGKVNLIKEILSTLAKIDNQIILSEFVKQLADRVSVSEESLWMELKKMRAGKRGVEKEDDSLRERIPVFSSIREAEITLIKLMFKEKSLIKELKSLMHEDFF
ncbi:MAG: DNA primase, partial [Candidatus Omnitrophica bacterium]|nr:DNA primase [Candidatus Omnitrophota bacterium]